MNSGYTLSEHEQSFKDRILSLMVQRIYNQSISDFGSELHLGNLSDFNKQLNITTHGIMDNILTPIESQKVPKKSLLSFRKG